MFESLIAKFAGGFIKKKIKLQEGPMDSTKKWYQSKNVWTGVVTAAMGAYVTLVPVFHLPAVPEWIFTLLGAIGIYTRVTADSKIG